MSLHLLFGPQGDGTHGLVITETSDGGRTGSKYSISMDIELEEISLPGIA